MAGTACCVVSAVGYTVANTCMRQLAELQADEMWATCNKELITVVVVGPWLVAQLLRHRSLFPPWGAIGLLTLVGLSTQMVANLGLQWAFGIIGLSIAIPVVFAMMLTTSAAMGWALLNERVSKRSMGAIGLLLVALACLAVGLSLAKVEETEIPPSTEVAATSDEVAPAPSDLGGFSPWVVVGAVLAAGLAGALYAVLTITIRHTVTGATSPAAVVLIITGVGVLSLGSVSYARLGLAELLATPWTHFGWMFLAGGFNLIAFLAITKGLQLTTVVHANVLNASQVAMAAVVGILLFKEHLNPWLILGVSLTITGIVLIDRPENDEEKVDQHA